MSELWWTLCFNEKHELLRWIAYHTDVTPSEAVLRAFDLLVAWVGGTHHIEDCISLRSKKNPIRWDHPYMLDVCYSGQMATYDFDELTRLVFLAHDCRVRVELRGAGLYLHPRKRNGGMSERHPTVEQALSQWRGE
jgi:hypothetical protein